MVIHFHYQDIIDTYISYLLFYNGLFPIGVRVTNSARLFTAGEKSGLFRSKVGVMGDHLTDLINMADHDEWKKIKESLCIDKLQDVVFQ